MKYNVKLSRIIACLGMIFSLAILAQSPVFAQGSTVDPGQDGGQGNITCNQRFLTFPAWYRGIVDDSCEIKSPSSPEFGEQPFAGFIGRIGINIVEIILNAVGYAAVGFIIYGGYKYMISAGSPDGMVAARKTILNASIGLVISVAAVAIVNTIANAF